MYMAITGLHSTVDPKTFGFGGKSFLWAAQVTESAETDGLTRFVVADLKALGVGGNSF